MPLLRSESALTGNTCRRVKACHSRPHGTLAKYRGEYSGTNTRQVASAWARRSDAPRLRPSSIIPTGTPSGTLVSCRIASLRSSQSLRTQKPGSIRPSVGGAWAWLR